MVIFHYNMNIAILYYPLVNIQKNYGKSSFLMGKLTIILNGHFQ